jgi:hypothetical protein
MPKLSVLPISIERLDRKEREQKKEEIVEILVKVFEKSGHKKFIVTQVEKVFDRMGYV